MWIIKCTEVRTNRQFDVGPFGTDERAEDAAAKPRAKGHVSTDVQPLVEPDRRWREQRSDARGEHITVTEGVQNVSTAA